MAFTRILAFTANVKRKVAPSFMAPESCQTTPSLKNDSSNNAGILADRRSLKTGFKDDSCVEGTSADPMDVSSIINIYPADKKNKSSIIRSAKEASAENKESIGPRLSRRNQSLRGCPEQLACQENLAGTLTKSETNSLDKSSNRSSIQIDANLISSCTFAVLYPYLPVESDELRIEPGDQVRLLHLFSDGWIFVQKANDGSIGAVPAVCLDTDPSVFVDYGKEEQEADCTDGTNAY
ncbi:hypothetical protein FB639_006161 [Coemansia asiatica]|nr:hypothetical protein FB639_006161 [Coemansia asiatica]